MHKLGKIYIANNEIRERDGGDLWSWFTGINSITFPSSVKAVVNRNGKWENCIVSGRISYNSKDRLQMCLYFDDSTILEEEGSRQAFLSEEMQSGRYKELLLLEKQSPARRKA